MTTSRIIIIPVDVQAERADRILADLLPDVSRSAAARLIREERALMDGAPIRPSTSLKAGDTVTVLMEDSTEPAEASFAAAAFDLLYEDDDIVVVNKPPGVVVHPGSGRPSGTLMDALVATRPEMIGVGQPGRWGIAHRLDRDTSGVMVVAKTTGAYEELAGRFKAHTIRRVYLAVVRGAPGSDTGMIDTPIGRHASDRKRISTSTPRPRAAVTRWAVKERLDGLTLLEIQPETGRTHQIRVHLASIGLPVAGDPTYGKLRRAKIKGNPRLNEALAVLKRQALHAAVLGFPHPISGRDLEFSSEMPEDMARAIELCRSGD